MPDTPAAPLPEPISAADPKLKLVDSIKDALRTLPAYFASTTTIEGLEAGDLFSLNTVLGGAIEVQVVETLNRIRGVWDPDEEWTEYRFERSAQTFPDVRLISRQGGTINCAVGIELKGWYLLAKEKEPSFRYAVTPDACAVHDLLVVVPWHLKNVLSGTPVVKEPLILQARYAALYRNHWWQHVRNTTLDTTIVHPAGASPYPDAKAEISDKPAADGGGNFGRVARIGLMDDWTTLAVSQRVVGISAQHWIDFLKAYAETSDPDQVATRVAALVERTVKAAKKARAPLTEADAERLHELMTELARFFDTTT